LSYKIKPDWTVNKKKLNLEGYLLNWPALIGRGGMTKGCEEARAVAAEGSWSTPYILFTCFLS
jgi:hypothetical protein